MTENHNFLDPDKLIKKQGVSAQGILIEDDVWIAENTVILDGVHIGRGAVIAADAVVTKHVEKYVIVAGVPARKMGYVRRR